MPDATIHSTNVICRQPGRYIGWPTIDMTPDNELIVVFSGDRDRHVDPFGKTQMIRSRDLGKTWSCPSTINDTPMDDRDAGLVCLRDGTMVVSWFTRLCTVEEHSARCSGDEVEVKRGRDRLNLITPMDMQLWVTPNALDSENRRGHFTRRSTDGGISWEPAVRCAASSPHGPTQLSDGRLLFFGTGSMDRKHGTGHMLAEESTDGGQSWRVIGSVPLYPKEPVVDDDVCSYLVEPHVVEAADGRLVGLTRHEFMPRQADRPATPLYQFESSDGGHTWTDPTPTEIIGKPPHLTRLQDGRLLASIGYRHEPYGERVVISDDHGKTWSNDNLIVLRDDSVNGDLGYPASKQLPDGSIYTVYYEHFDDGEKTVLVGTHWSLD